MSTLLLRYILQLTFTNDKQNPIQVPEVRLNAVVERNIKKIKKEIKKIMVIHHQINMFHQINQWKKLMNHKMKHQNNLKDIQNHKHLNLEDLQKKKEMKDIELNIKQTIIIIIQEVFSSYLHRK